MNYSGVYAYPPHAACRQWDWSLITLHLVSDILIALAYVAIPLALLYLVRCYRAKRMSKLLLLCGASIFLSGAARATGAITIWYQFHWVEGLVKAAAAVVSVAAAVAVIWTFKTALSTLGKLADLQGRVERRIDQLEHDARYSREDDREAVRTLTELKGVVERVLSFAPNDSGKA